MPRGVIRNRDFGKQIKDFSSLRFEHGITPTDIDGFVEFNDEVFVIIEVKYNETSMPYGQRLALERLVDVLSKNKFAILIIAKHDRKAEEDIDVGNCLVTEYRINETWRMFHREVTVRQLIDFYRMAIGELK